AVDFANDGTRFHELSMIENVEEFCTKFQGGPFSNSGVLVKSKIPIVDPRSMKKAALCVSHAAQDFLREGRGIKEQVPLLSRVEEMDRLAVVVGHVYAVKKRKLPTFFSRLVCRAL